MLRLKSLLIKLNQRRDLYLLLASFCFLGAALVNPSFMVKHNIYSYFIVLDITQSMNTSDLKMHGQAMTRLDYSKVLIRNALSSLPCGTKVGLGLFSGVNVVALYTPIELCANFSSLQETLEHSNWRNAWTADSRIREGLLASAQVMNNFPEPAQLVLLTDGEEAPKLHTFNTRDLSTFQNGDGWLIVGIGSDAGGPIPKFDERNQKIGYWSHESMQLAPGAAPIAAAGILQRKSDFAEGPQDRYLSKLAENYLQSTAKEIGAHYVRGDSLQSLLTGMLQQKPARRERAPITIDWLLAILSGLTLLSAYLPWHLIHKKKNKVKQANSPSLSYEDQTSYSVDAIESRL